MAEFECTCTGVRGTDYEESCEHCGPLDEGDHLFEHGGVTWCTYCKQAVYLVFWNTWCTYCMMALGYKKDELEELVNNHNKNTEEK